MYIKTLGTMVLWGSAAAFSAHAETPRRSVIHCLTSGDVGIDEFAPGKFRAASKFACFGVSRAECHDKTVALGTELKEGKCVISVRDPASGAVHQQYEFPMKTDGHKRMSMTVGEAKNTACVIGRRYLPTLGACKVPTKDNPGDDCNGERGKPVHIAVPGASFEGNRIVASPGGLTVTSYVKPEADEFVSGDLTSAGLRPDYLSLWQSPKGEWCVFQTKYSTARPWGEDKCKEKLKGQLPIRDPSGAVVGVLQKNGAALKLVSVTSSGNGDFELAAGKPALHISQETERTRFRSLGANGAVNPGEVVVEGEITAAYNWTQDDSFNLGAGKSVRSDCNGVHAVEATQSVTPGKH
jgi:hypothetical protein